MLRIENTGKSQMKSRNRVRVFREILNHEGISRKQLEKRLGLSAPSVTRVVEELLREGLICEEGTEQTHMGRRPVMLCVKKNAYYSVGMNLSRSRLYYCIRNLGGEPVHSGEIRLLGKTKGDQLLSLMEHAVQDCLETAGIEKKHLLAIGIASRGTVNEGKGSVIYSPDSGEEIHVKEYMGARYDCEILVENNVIADLKGQYLDLSGTNRNLVYLYISDGVGGSIICNGQVIDGENSMAGKFAHILVESGGRRCACGKRGHLESYVSKPAMEEAYFEASGKRLELPEICRLAGEGEKAAAAVLKDAIDKLAIGINQILLVVNPGTLVLYGDLFESVDRILERLKQKTKELAFTEEIADNCWMVRETKNVRIEDSIARLSVERALEIIV